MYQEIATAFWDGAMFFVGLVGFMFASITVLVTLGVMAIFFKVLGKMLGMQQKDKP